MCCSQEWTRGKKIAAMIKKCFAPKPVSTIPPEQYQKQFVEYFRTKFVADASPVHSLMMAKEGADEERMQACANPLRSHNNKVSLKYKV